MTGNESICPLGRQQRILEAEWLKEWVTSVFATEIAEFSEKKISKSPTALAPVASVYALWLAH